MRQTNTPYGQRSSKNGLATFGAVLLLFLSWWVVGVLLRQLGVKGVAREDPFSAVMNPSPDGLWYVRLLRFVLAFALVFGFIALMIELDVPGPY